MSDGAKIPRRKLLKEDIKLIVLLVVQALKDITDDFNYRRKMESVLKVAQAVLNNH
jgi:hypothetical protein